MQEAPELIWDYNGDQNSPALLNKCDTSYIITRRQVSYLLHNMDEIQKILRKEIRHIPETNVNVNSDQVNTALPATNCIKSFLSHSDKFPYVLIALQMLSLIIDTILINKQIFQISYVTLISVCIESILFFINFVQLIGKLKKNFKTINCTNIIFSIISLILVFASINSIIIKFNCNSWKPSIDAIFCSDNLFIVLYLQMVYDCMSTFFLQCKMIPISLPSYLSTITLIMLSYCYLVILFSMVSVHLYLKSLDSHNPANPLPRHRNSYQYEAALTSAPIGVMNFEPVECITPLGQSYIAPYEGFNNMENSANEHRLIDTSPNDSSQEPLHLF